MKPFVSVGRNGRCENAYRRWLGRNIVRDPVDTSDFVCDARRNATQNFWREREPVIRHIPPNKQRITENGN